MKIRLMYMPLLEWLHFLDMPQLHRFPHPALDQQLTSHLWFKRM